MTQVNTDDLGRILKQQRVMIPMTLRGLSAVSGVSSSHLGRIERGERFPSARILRKLSEPLGFEEHELFMLAGFLSHGSLIEADSHQSYSPPKRVDRYVTAVLSHEPVTVQRTIVAILSVLKTVASSIAQENSRNNTRETTSTNLTSENLE